MDIALSNCTFEEAGPKHSAVAGKTVSQQTYSSVNVILRNERTVKCAGLKPTRRGSEWKPVTLVRVSRLSCSRGCACIANGHDGFCNTDSLIGAEHVRLNVVQPDSYCKGVLTDSNRSSIQTSAVSPTGYCSGIGAFALQAAVCHGRRGGIALPAPRKCSARSSKQTAPL